MDKLTKRDTRTAARSTARADGGQVWTEELGVSIEQLQKAVEKVGNSATTVRKELKIIAKQ